MGEPIEKLQRDVAQWKPGTTSKQLENSVESVSYHNTDKPRNIETEAGNSGRMVESTVLAKNKSLANLRPWQPGQSGNPAGRPTKARELAILDSITNAFSPEEITSMLREAYRLAQANDSARGIVAVLEFMADRAVGKPVQRIETNSNGLQDILEMLGPAE